MAKLKLALYWSASCGGCDVAVLDINEKILEVAEMADIVFWPIALDFKRHHVEAM
ncbi:MAG: oxidoreductase, partial [Chloroflexi bacterium]|nr:oxidoreductase [Chloroflexota bacterium]